MRYFNHPIKEKRETKPPSCQSERYNKGAHKGCSCGCKGHTVPVTVRSFKENVKFFSL